MMIYVNGDSWSKNTWTADFPYDLSWPKCIQDKYDINVINESAGCGSNSRMLENLQRFYQLGNKPDLVLISLSNENRWHLPAKNLSSWNIGPTVINDVTGVVDETILKWWSINCVDLLEYVYQYYNVIWKIHEFCSKVMECPVIFFNAWSDLEEIDHKLFATGDTSIREWVLKHIENKNPTDIFFQKYVTLLKFFYHEKQKWNFDQESWKSRLDRTEICGAKDFHPRHPNKKGGERISTFVLDSIFKYQPKIHAKLFNQY
jgi:hypothetical protein